MSKSMEKAYTYIREMILDGGFVPDQHLSEEQLSEEIGVSRTPIRDALKRLERDYFVVIQANRGARVRRWLEEDIDDLFNLRAMIEGFAARRAAARATDAQIRALFEQTDRIDVALQDPENIDLETFLDGNKKYHQIMCEASASVRLIDMIDGLVAQAVIVRTAQGYSFSDLLRSNMHHREMAEAVAARDGDLAESVMRAHLLAALRSYKAAQKSLPIEG